MINLANNLNIQTPKTRIAKIRKINPSILIGSGILNDIKKDIISSKINLLIVNTNLTPRQQKNLEDHLKIKVTDRTGIILEIFAKRAKTKEGKLQVELAELTYRKSRLVRAWTHLERQRGGTTFIGGPGELQIELDRRLIQEKINKIKKHLIKVDNRRGLQRKLRKKTKFKTFALIGYTNAGKTQLFNYLTKKSQLSEDKLFVTLDTKISKIYLDKNIEAGLIDTVGFINKIPSLLIQSFKATFEEVRNADYIINVVDSNDLNFKEKITNTIKTLQDMNLEKDRIKNIITVYNKIDLNMNMSIPRNKDFYISAISGEGVHLLKEQMKEILN
tara:strand:- start:814 stop:1806 length:993 start_codon:yes stop_codon:yes gene_type:complete